MRVTHLSLQNIGPFIEAKLEFVTEADEKPPVILITGENGTGKSIILDAIRSMFGPDYAKLERDIQRRKHDGPVNINITLQVEQERLQFDSHQVPASTSTHGGIVPSHPLAYRPKDVKSGGEAPNWIVDFWPSSLASGSFEVQTLASPKHQNFLIGALQGKKAKADIAQLICHFDYLRDSRDEQEQATGSRLYTILEDMVARSLLNGGQLSHVSRATYEPIIIQNGQSVSLANLSSGNLYLIENLVSLLGKMYSVNYLRQEPLSQLGQTPGLLLIDEAENQLHPKWQKRLLETILHFFPNLQIIATTHSPFIISSVPHTRLFVCRSKGDHCVVDDETAVYRHKPVDEILMSPLFEATRPFNEDITQLMNEREAAIKAGDTAKRERIETQLKAKNPDYFSYFDVDKLIKDLTGADA